MYIVHGAEIFHCIKCNAEFKAKIGFMSDSTTAIGRWKSLTLPVGAVDFLSAKARRFYSWADKVAGTIYWPFCISDMSGDDISLPHMMTHLGDLAKARQEEDAPHGGGGGFQNEGVAVRQEPHICRKKWSPIRQRLRTNRRAIPVRPHIERQETPNSRFILPRFWI